MKRRRGVLLTLLIVPALACRLILGIDDHDFRSPDEIADAGPDTADTAPPDLCPHAGAPSQPNLPPVGPDFTFTFAIRRSSIAGTTPAGTPAGFDLDNACTCDPRDPRSKAGPTCTPPKGVTSDSLCDGDGGIDNVGAGLITTLQTFVPGGDISRALNTETECGRQSMLYVVEKYNGEADDSFVQVRPLVSHGTEAHEGGVELVETCGLDGGAPGEGGAYPARFDESDRWTLPTSSRNGANYNVNAFTGWVRGYRLVIDGRESTSVLPLLLFGSNAIAVSTPVFSGQLVPLDEAGADLPVGSDGKVSWRNGAPMRFRIANGQIAGRAPATDLLTAVGKASVGISGTGPQLVCNQGYFSLVKSSICAAVDTVQLKIRDNQNDPCDSLSMAFQFEAWPASIGGVRDIAPPTGSCDADFACRN